jgi:hypothetical protein
VNQISNDEGEATMTTETMQEAPAKLWCDNPEHAEAGSAIPAVYRTTWPDGRFKSAYACEDCLDEQLRFYVLDDDMDGRLHPVLVELAGDVIEADEAKAEHFARDVQLLAGAKLLGSITARQYRVMEAAVIEMLQNGPAAAMQQWILNALPPPVDEGDGLGWDGKESAAAWFDRVEAADRAAEAEATR